MDRKEYADLVADTERALAASESFLKRLRESEVCLKDMIAALEDELRELAKLSPAGKEN